MKGGERRKEEGERREKKKRTKGDCLTWGKEGKRRKEREGRMRRKGVYGVGSWGAYTVKGTLIRPFPVLTSSKLITIAVRCSKSNKVSPEKL